jgi:hypothetical protein
VFEEREVLIDRSLPVLELGVEVDEECGRDMVVSCAGIEKIEHCISAIHRRDLTRRGVSITVSSLVLRQRCALQIRGAERALAAAVASLDRDALRALQRAGGDGPAARRVKAR